MEILGCRLDLVDSDEATSRILSLARNGDGAHVVTLGTEMVVQAQKDARFRSIVNASALSLCDTVGLLAVSRHRGGTLRDRVTGVELIQHLCARAAIDGTSIYFLGGAPGVAADAAGILEALYPGLRVAGTRDGFFNDARVDDVVGAIKASGAQLLLVGMGSPRQEYWLADHLRDTGCGVGIGVGGSFDVIGGRIERAPQQLRRLGMEWLYRLIKEPHRWRRQLALPYFVWLVMLDEIGLWGKRGKRA